MITIQVSSDGKRLRLYNDSDEKMAAILDNWWKEQYGKGEYPAAGYSARFDADAYEVTAEQLVSFLAQRLGVTVAAPTGGGPPGASSPGTVHRSKQPISEAQRQARRENARKAAQARRKHHTNHTV